MIVTLQSFPVCAQAAPQDITYRHICMYVYIYIMYDMDIDRQTDRQSDRQTEMEITSAVCSSPRIAGKQFMKIESALVSSIVFPVTWKGIKAFNLSFLSSAGIP